MKENNVYLWHILEAIESIQLYTVNMNLEEFYKTPLVQDAVIRKLEIIGEAASKLDQDIRLAISNIPWGEISDMRNKLIHEYFGVDIDIVWETVNQYLPILQEAIKSYFKN